MKFRQCYNFVKNQASAPIVQDIKRFRDSGEGIDIVSLANSLIGGDLANGDAFLLWVALGKETNCQSLVSPKTLLETWRFPRRKSSSLLQCVPSCLASAFPVTKRLRLQRRCVINCVIYFNNQVNVTDKSPSPGTVVHVVDGADGGCRCGC